jgi:hypothetical protein
METFQKNVITISIVVLIFFLFLIGVILYRNKSNTAYPPVVADCPDYWEDLSVGNSSHCVNKKNLGKSSCSKIMDFSTSTWSGQRGLCNKSKWAKACDLTWDGVTNNNKVCDFSAFKLL